MTAFKGRGLIQLTGKDTNMSTLLNKPQSGVVSVAKMAIAGEGYSESSISNKNKKIDLTVYAANGGFIVEVGKGYHSEGELYIIGEGQDLGQEIGKIITYNKLST